MWLEVAIFVLAAVAVVLLLSWMRPVLKDLAGATAARGGTAAAEQLQPDPTYVASEAYEQIVRRLDVMKEDREMVAQALNIQTEATKLLVQQILMLLAGLKGQAVLGGEANERIEAASALVAKELLESQDRAEDVGATEPPGSAADAASRRANEP